MLKQTLLVALLIGVGFAVKAQEGTPRPSFFEEERRLRTPTEAEVTSDKEKRTSSGFSDTFLTDALGGVGDPGQSSESSGGLKTTSITPNQPQAPVTNIIPPAPPTGGFGEGVFVNPPLR